MVLGDDRYLEQTSKSQITQLRGLGLNKRVLRLYRGLDLAKKEGRASRWCLIQTRKDLHNQHLHFGCSIQRRSTSKTERDIKQMHFFLSGVLDPRLSVFDVGQLGFLFPFFSSCVVECVARNATESLPLHHPCRFWLLLQIEGHLLRWNFYNRTETTFFSHTNSMQKLLKLF